MTMVGFKVKLSNQSSWLKDAGHSIEEEARLYEELLDDVYRNPSWYLNNFYYMSEFRVRWANYRANKPILPHKYTAKARDFA